MAAAVALSPPPSTTNKQMASTAPAHSCPNCGENVDVEQLVRDAQKQIRDLEAQVEFLKEKATAAGTLHTALSFLALKRRASSSNEQQLTHWNQQ
jgi:predicted RNA-binding Zn-ribbon protein involved in translation (DUF1610 family)